MGARETCLVLQRSRYPLEAWLDASTRRRTPAGVGTVVRRVADGAPLDVWLPKEPIPYYVHAIVEFAGREPQFVREMKRLRTEVCERYLFTEPSVLFVYKWIEGRFFDADAGEPATRNVLYVCASDAQIARSKEVMASLAGTWSPPGQARRVALLASPGRQRR